MNLKNVLIMSSLIVGCGASASAKITYPDTRKVDTVDVYFGEKVADPYRWLEDDNSAETAAWVAEENAITRNYLDNIPFRNQLRDRFKHIFNYEKMGSPFKVKNKYYFYKNDGLQNQSVLYQASNKDLKDARVFLDPNKLSADGTVALQSVYFSKNGKYASYVISRSGSDWNEIYVMDVATGKVLPDHIVWAKFTGATWRGDGFYYSAYDAPADGKGLSGKNEFQKVYYHKIGTDQNEDKLIYKDDRYPLRFYSAGVSEDERYLFMYESEGRGNSIYVKDLKKKDADYVCIARNIDKDNIVIDSDKDYIYLMTNDGAPKYKLLAYPIKNLSADNFKTIIPEREHVLSGASIIDGKWLLNYIENVANHAYIYSLDGSTKIREITLPSVGTAGFYTDKKTKDVYYTFTSYTYPGTIFKYDLKTDKSTLFFSPKVDFKSDDYVTEQVKYPSKDGVMVNMFITHKKGLKMDGTNPTLLYGYGGFNISMFPGFSASRVPFIENGGIYVVANLRGGGEFGDDWYKAGTLLQKQNVFDDFISAAEYLIKNNYTSPDHLAINGGSNGGLLVGAVVNQRPDLFKAAVPQVGVMDMLRYHKFTIGWNWASDYGRSDDSKQMFEYLRGYSPLHTIKNDGTRYPAILVTTGDHDDRVVPAHSFKYAATLQASNTGDAPKLIRIDSKAGHGGGKPIAKIIEEQADIYSFIMYNLGMSLKK